MIIRLLFCLILLSTPVMAQEEMYSASERQQMAAEQQKLFEQEMLRQQQEEAAAAAQAEGGASNVPSPPRQQIIDSTIAPRLPPALERHQQKMYGLPRASSVWIRPGKIGENTAAYMTLYGAGTSHIIKSVSSPWAQRVDLHSTTTDDQGVAHMQSVDELALAADGVLEMAPGGTHVMFFGLRREIRPGQIVPITFTLEDGSTMRVIANVRNPASVSKQQPAPAMHQGH